MLQCCVHVFASTRRDVFPRRSRTSSSQIARQSSLTSDMTPVQPRQRFSLRISIFHFFFVFCICNWLPRKTVQQLLCRRFCFLLPGRRGVGCPPWPLQRCGGGRANRRPSPPRRRGRGRGPGAALLSCLLWWRALCAQTRASLAQWGRSGYGLVGVCVSARVGFCPACDRPQNLGPWWITTRSGASGSARIQFCASFVCGAVIPKHCKDNYAVLWHVWLWNKPASFWIPATLLKVNQTLNNI